MTAKKTDRPTRRHNHSIDWMALKARFLTHEFPNVMVMCQALGLPTGNMQRNAKGWADERKKLDEEALSQAKARIVQSRTELILDMQQRHLAIARELIEKGQRRLLRKFHDPVTGEPSDIEFENDNIALQAMRLGAAMEQGLLKGDAPAGGGGPTLNLNGPAQVLVNGNLDKTTVSAALRDYGDDDLRRMLSGIDDGPDEGGAKTIGGAGAASAKRIQGKRQ